jgi:Tol biopolymer transport system component
VNSDGTNLNLISDLSYYSFHPSFSPDGQSIAFTTDRSGNHDVWKMNIDGTGLTQLTSSSSTESAPTWSPNGQKIVYNSDISGNDDIFLMNQDGSSQTALTSFLSEDRFPDITQDGQKVAFSSNMYGPGDVFVMNSNGTGLTQVTTDPSANEWHPSFNPNGDKLTFIRVDVNNDIYMVDTNGANLTRLTYDQAFDTVNTWSADGNTIVFSTSRTTGNGSRKTIWKMTILQPDISVSPTSMNFGSITVGSSSTPQTFTVSNTGTVDLHISGIALSDTTNYSLNLNGGTSPCGSTTPTLTPDSSCTVTVTFSPTSAGQKDANLAVISDDPDIPTVNALLTGIGVMPPIIVVAPNGGEVIPSGSTYSIQWSAPSQAVKFDLKYSMNNGTTWKSIATKITGTSYNWIVPCPNNNKKTSFVKVIGYNSFGAVVGQDVSNSTFTIEVVKILSPNGGEYSSPGTTQAITWRTNCTIRPVAKVELYYTTGGGIWNLITTRTINNGSYPWTLPYVSSTKYKVKVILKDSAGTVIGNDVSDKVFTIKP